MIEGPQDGALAYEEEEYGHPSDLLLYDNDEYFMNDEDQQMPPDFHPDFRPQSRWFVLFVLHLFDEEFLKYSQGEFRRSRMVRRRYARSRLPLE